MEVIMLFVGIMFACIGGYMLRDELAFRKSARESRGEVIAIQTSRGSKGTTMYAPVVRYFHNNQAFEFTARVSSSSCSHDIGDEIAILLSPDSPPVARLKSPLMLVLSSIFLIGLVCSIAFFSTFEFNLTSVAIAGATALVIFTQLLFALKKRHIYSIDDLKRSIEESKQKNTSASVTAAATAETTPPQSRIRDKKVLHAKKNKPSALWISMLFLLIGLGLCGGGVYMALDRWHFLQNAQKIQGLVIDFERSTSTSDGQTTTMYAPIIEYTPPGLSPVKFTDDLSSSSRSHNIGDQVSVLYLPHSPSEAIMDKGLLNWFAPGLLSLMGVIFTLVSTNTIKRNIKLQKKAQAVELDF